MQTEEMSEQEEIFKACPMCAKHWLSRKSFLDDPELSFNGYQDNLGIFDQGLFYFTHDKGNCGSTMIVGADQFFSLYAEITIEGSKNLSGGCPGDCQCGEKLDRCQVHCESVFVRETCRIIKNRAHRTLRN